GNLRSRSSIHVWCRKRGWVCVRWWIVKGMGGGRRSRNGKPCRYLGRGSGREAVPLLGISGAERKPYLYLLLKAGPSVCRQLRPVTSPKRAGTGTSCSILQRDTGFEIGRAHV